MARYITNLKDLGKDLAWTLLQQARGIPEAKGIDDFLEDKTFVLLFAKSDLSERLCVTAAIRQMRGHAVYMGPEEKWEETISQFPAALMGSIRYYMDGVIVYGMRASQWQPGPEVDFPVLNVGSMDAHPAHAIADIACMMRYCHDDLRKVRIAWIGAPTGTMFSLMEATMFFPFAMQIALPDMYRNPIYETLASDYMSDITFFETPKEAVKNCQFVFAGNSGRGMLSLEQINRWSLTREIMSHAEDNAHVLLGTAPMKAIPIENEVIGSKNALLLLQAENRLRVYKRMLHWLYEY